VRECDDNTGDNSGSDRMRNGHVAPARCHHSKEKSCHPPKRVHNRGSLKGSFVLCLLEDTRSGLCNLSSGGVRRRLRLSAGASPPDSPRQRYSWRHGYQIYPARSIVGGPDTRTRHWQFIPFDPFLPGGMLWVVLPHQKCSATLT